MKRLFMILTILLTVQLCYGQSGTTSSKVESVRFDLLSDSLIKSEVAFFTLKGATLKKLDSSAKVVLTEIPIRYCSDQEVHLSLSTFTSSVSVFIYLFFQGEVPDKKLDSMILVTHSHFSVEFPESAFRGLIQSNSCNFSVTGKNDQFFSPYFKAFYSEDKKRLYIYMLGGTDTNMYEVTWVIINDKYITRIIDNLP